MNDGQSILPTPIPNLRAYMPDCCTVNCAEGLICGMFPGPVMPKLIQQPSSLVSILVSCGGRVLFMVNGRVTVDEIAWSFKVSAHQFPWNENWCSVFSLLPWRVS